MEHHSTELIIMGDFNYKEIDWEQETTSVEDQTMFMECIQQNFLTQHVKEVTRFRGDDVPSRVDLIFTKDEDSIEEIEYQSPLGKSDHKVLIFNIKVCIYRTNNVEKKKMYKKANMEEIRAEMNSTNWNEALNVEEYSMEEIIHVFNTRLNDIMDRHIPTANIDQKLEEFTCRHLV